MIVDFQHHFTPRELIKQDPGDKLTAAIGEVPHTPLDVAVARALEDLRAIA